MLYELRSSSSNLRVQNSRRHNIRNLRAKVRSLLPEAVCPRQIKRKNRVNHIRQSDHFQEVDKFTPDEVNKRLNKQFDKLSPQQIEEINGNKYYFLGTGQAITYFQQYLRENKSKYLEQPFKSPSIIQDSSALAFLPPSLLSGQLVSNRRSTVSVTSLKEFQQKRGSTATTHQRKRSCIQSRQTKRDQRTSKQKVYKCQTRKTTLDEELKVKKEMSFNHLQRQQNIASINRQNHFRQKLQTMKLWSNAHNSASKEHKNSKNIVQKYQVATLTAKLRKICLKRTSEPPQFNQL